MCKTQDQLFIKKAPENTRCAYKGCDDPERPGVWFQNGESGTGFLYMGKNESAHLECYVELCMDKRKEKN